jgi:hypothetical protein
MPFVGIGVRVGGNSARTSYAKQLAKAYAARVIADGGVVESLGCFTAFATALGASESNFDADYQAVLNYATTQGYNLPTYSQRLKQNQLLLDLKAGGIWSKLDTFGVFATDGDSDFALIDWKRLTDYTAINSPTFTSNQGFTGDGTSSYIKTGFVPNLAVNYTLNSASQGFWLNSGLIGSYTNLGSREGFLNKMSYDFSQSININANSSANISGITNGKLYQYNRSDASNVERFINGSSIGTDLVNSSALNAFEFYALALNNANSPLVYSTNELSMVYASSDLSSEALDFYNAFNSYMTSI